MLHLLGAFIAYMILTGKRNDGTSPAVATPAAVPPAGAPTTGPVFPSVPPATLPAFPGPGWCEDDPPPVEVTARATALSPSLWATGAPGAHVTELTGGRWITYAAEIDAATNTKAVHVYRSTSCPPLPSQVPAVAPTPIPAVQPTPTPQAAPQAAPVPTAQPAVAPVPTAQPAVAPAPAVVPSVAPAVVPSVAPAVVPSVFTPTPLQATAIAMANALASRAADGTGKGAYRLRDQAIYKAFQTAVSLNPDGYPGTGTMTMLSAVLGPTGVPMPQVTIYPWKAAGGWKHPNAPTSAEWNS